MTTGTGPLLRSGNIKDYTPLGEEGNPVYKWATQIRVTIRRKISSESMNVFAIPQPNENGDIIDWYSPESGAVIPWSSATREEKISAKEQLSNIQQKLNVTEEFNNDSEQSIFKRLLGHVIQFPDDEHVYLVNGKPVLTFWGFVDSDANIRPDPLAILSIPELPGTVESIPVDAVAHVTETLPVKRRFSWWWLLALLPLLLLLFFLLRGCEQDLDIPVLNSTDIEPVDSLDPYIERNRINEGVSTSSVNGINSPLSPLDGDDSSGLNEEPEEIEPVEPEPEAQDPLTEQPEPQEPEAEEPEAEEPPPEESENNEEEAEQPDDMQAPNENPPLNPLAIPEQSEQQKAMGFLNGRWQADSGLMDKQGRPVKLEYDFKDGKGNVRIKRNDGTVCSGTVEASMKNSELTFSDNEVIKCPSGQSYRPAKVKCKADSNNKTLCEGSYSGGENFKMDINKSAETE